MECAKFGQVFCAGIESQAVHDGDDAELGFGYWGAVADEELLPDDVGLFCGGHVVECVNCDAFGQHARAFGFEIVIGQ